MFEARVNTVDAIEPTVYVESLTSRCAVNPAFSSLGVGSSSKSSAQFSCSYCCLRVFIPNLHTRYVTMAIRATPAMTPPAIAPTSGPLEDEDVEAEAAAAADAAAGSLRTHDVEGHL